MPRKEVLDVVKAWIQKAENDIANINIVLPHEDAPYDTVCFHAQQASEKYIKALLTYLGIPFPKSHDLELLVSLFKTDEGFLDAVGDVTELSDAGVISRYPDGDMDEFTRDVAERLTNKAMFIKTLVIKKLESLGYEIDNYNQS